MKRILIINEGSKALSFLKPTTSDTSCLVKLHKRDTCYLAGHKEHLLVDCLGLLDVLPMLIVDMVGGFLCPVILVNGPINQSNYQWYQFYYCVLVNSNVFGF